MPQTTKERRAYWVSELSKLGGSFGVDSTTMMAELKNEIERDGFDALLDHLRTCGAVPECYGHDSSEEKLYSKYTDAVVSEALNVIGLTSIVIKARSDTADVQARCETYSLVADAKAFRLSRTAKNQKDFKVQAMRGWRGNLDYAMVVCPIYQLPGRTSQIYRQATSDSVCIVSYTHLGALVAFSRHGGNAAATSALHEVLRCVSTLNPNQNALDYWTGINRALVSAMGKNSSLWDNEKRLSLESLALVKDEALRFLQSERNRILGLGHQQALDELLRASKLDSRMAQIQRVEYGNLLGAH